MPSFSKSEPYSARRYRLDGISASGGDSRLIDRSTVQENSSFFALEIGIGTDEKSYYSPVEGYSVLVVFRTPFRATNGTNPTNSVE